MIATPLSVREAVDPKGLLPQVDLVSAWKDPHYFEITHKDQVVGTVWSGKTKEGEAYLENPEVYKQQQGYGTAAFLIAIEWAHERGEVFRTDPYAHTEAAVALWNRFIRAGIGEVVRLFEEVASKNMDPDAYVGYVRITPRGHLDLTIDRNGTKPDNY